MPGGVVHKLPGDLREALIANTTALALWKDITPLGRNEFICWVEDAKQEATRDKRLTMLIQDSAAGRFVKPYTYGRESNGRPRQA